MGKIQSSLKVLLVSNLEQSKSYYANVLGCEVTDFWAVRDDFALGFKLIQAHSPEDVSPNRAGRDQETAWDVYAYVETHAELDKLYEELKEKGARFTQEPVLLEMGWGAWKEFAVSDPDHYVIGFGSGKKD